MLRDIKYRLESIKTSRLGEANYRLNNHCRNSNPTKVIHWNIRTEKVTPARLALNIIMSVFQSRSKRKHYVQRNVRINDVDGEVST
jgi:hypothetical protein